MHVSVVGNYGTGKTTLVSELSEDLDWMGLTEVQGRVIDSFHNDPNRWAFCNQIDYYDLYLKQALQVRENRDEGVIQERGLLEADNVFTTSMKDEGYLSEEEVDILESVIITYKKMIDVKPDLIIHVFCDFDVMLDRIAERGRQHEQDIDRVYLNSLNTKYEDWLNSIDYCPVIKIDSGERDFRRESVREEIINEIQEVTGEELLS